MFHRVPQRLAKKSCNPEPRKKAAENSGKTKVLSIRASAKKNSRPPKSYGFLKTSKNLRENMVFGLQSWQRARATQMSSQPTVRNCAGIPWKTLEFLGFPDGPRPGNGLSPGIPLATRTKSYGFLKTLGNPWKSLHSHPKLRMAD